MSNTAGNGPYREAVSVFADEKSLEAAIDALLSSGFNRADLSLLASEEAVEKSLGSRYVRVRDMEDDPAVPRTAYVAPESRGDAEGGIIGALSYVGATAAAGAIVASGGAMAAVIAGAAIAGGTGALVGTALAALIGKGHADRIQDQLDEGGLLLWVRTGDSAHEERALGLLKQHGGRDVHVHTLP